MPRTRSERPSSATSVRIVWHYQASDELRTFVVHYRLRGVAVAYDDVVDVNLKVWGSEWKEPLGRLTATETAPGKILRAWGHPVYVRGDVELAGKKARPPGAERARRAVRRAPHRDPALGVHARRPACASPPATASQKIVAEETADAAALREGQRADRQREAAPVALRALPAPARHGPRVSRRRRLSSGSTGASSKTRLRPRVRAGAADGDGARARPDAAAPGWRGRLVRVHRDALRPDPPRRLHVDAGHDRAGDLGRAAQRERLRPRARRREDRTSR